MADRGPTDATEPWNQQRTACKRKRRDIWTACEVSLHSMNREDPGLTAPPLQQ